MFMNIPSSSTSKHTEEHTVLTPLDQLCPWTSPGRWNVNRSVPCPAAARLNPNFEMVGPLLAWVFKWLQWKILLTFLTIPPTSVPHCGQVKSTRNHHFNVVDPPQHNLVYLGWYNSQIYFSLFYLDLISTKKYVLGSSLCTRHCARHWWK